MFIDRMNRTNPTPQIGQIESTNPCGEQPLLPYESCNLGSINLSKMVKANGNGPQVDYEKLQRIVQTAVRFLDNVIDMNHYPLPKIAEMTGVIASWVGVMGYRYCYSAWHTYDSEEAVKVAEGRNAAFPRRCGLRRH